MKGQYLILIVGHNASGKTTLASELLGFFGDINRVSNDDIRELLMSKVSYFSDTNHSYTSHKSGTMNNIAYAYKEVLAKELLSAGQSILIDGGGITKEKRKENLSFARHACEKITTLIIEVEIDEKKLLERLFERNKKNKNHKWVDFYQNIRKKQYETVAENEADYVLKFNQHNKEKIISKLKKILQ